jgi:hypothetical protein
MRWARHVAQLGEISACRFSVGKPEEKRSLGKRRLRWDNMKMDPKEIEWEDMDQTYQAQG